MPIRAENRARYPADWPQISTAIRLRAGNICEACKAPNGAMIRRATSKEWGAVWRLASDSAFENGRCASTGAQRPGTMEDECGYGPAVKVVLTVAHLDHQPENCDPENLRAWCQRCHNTYDAPTRRAGTASRAKARLAVADLFQDPTA
jgi:5-methylcytosine-specific restriction endonuclease McrA